MNMKTGDFSPIDAQELLASVFAPWVQALNIRVAGFDEAGGDFEVPENRDICLRGGPGEGVICGQAVCSIADTVAVLTLAGVNKRFRNCTTLDLSCNFLRPLPVGPVDVRAEAISNGRKTAVVRCEFRSAGSSKLAATANCAFLYLED
ncbi:MAG: PaaI family thioesterase [Rhizobiaceae bacterium]